MTREEAKRRMEICRDFLANNFSDMGEPNFTAFNMAIQALSQEPCDDAISRDMALEKMADYVASGYAVSEVDFEKYSRIICQLPSVTQKSETVTEFADRCRECGKMRKGHWIYDETIENWRCSKCNETPKTMGYVGTADFMAEHFKFCNHCGAKMESEE